MKAASGLWGEFKRFAVKGNAMDLAVAVVVGNAFTGIVNSLVADIITPLLGLLTSSGHTDFKTLKIVLREANAMGPALTLNYGSLIQATFNFLIIALSIFLFFKLISMTRKRLFREEKEEKVPPHEKPAQERLLEEIRDLLKKQQS